MKADAAVINGLLVNSQSIYPGVIYIREGKIVGITESLEDRPREMIDAKGLYILPGAIDPHTHIQMKMSGLPKPGFDVTSVAAAFGGTSS